MALRNAELFRAAHRADAAIQGVRERLQALAHALAQERPGNSGADAGMSATALAAAVREGFDALSVIVTRDGEAVGAAMAPARADSDGGTGPRDAHTTVHGDDGEGGRGAEDDVEVATAHVVSRAAWAEGTVYEITLVLAEAPSAEEAELLDVVVSFGRLLGD